MKTLTVFYDPACGLCAAFRNWLEIQPKRVEVKFLPYDSPAALDQFPELMGLGPDEDVVVMADDGRWWQGPAAWITCLWVTRDHRDWAFRLAKPAFQPFVRRVVHLLSENRIVLSRLFRLRHDLDLAKALGSLSPPVCVGSACRIDETPASNHL